MKYNKNEIIGKMRDKIDVQNVTRTKSATGFISEAWSTVASVWTFVETKINQSNESIIDGKNTAKNTAEFTIRKLDTITEESRIIWNGNYYQVKNIKLSHDRRFITFYGVAFDSY